MADTPLLAFKDFEVIKADGAAVDGHSQFGLGVVIDAGRFQSGDEFGVDEGLENVVFDDDAEVIPLAFFEVEFSGGLGGGEDFFVFGREDSGLAALADFEVH